MKIGAYILTKNAKQNYSKECFNVRQNAGLAVIIDVLERKGYTVEYCSNANVHKYDVVLFAMTSDCDWWEFIAERVKWQAGNYKVVVGGAGVLNVRPFLPYVDYFVLGRGEALIGKLIDSLAKYGEYEGASVINSKTFSIDKSYMIAQTTEPYQHELVLESGKTYKENVIGCNHRCLFCGYTWHRKNITAEAFKYSWLWGGSNDSERAILDINTGMDIDWVKLRTTAIDGMSERLRYMVNKRISREMLRDFLGKMARCEKPHQLKVYNIVGYPTESVTDWYEFVEDVSMVDSEMAKQEKQTCLLLHSTPFRPMPATPMATAPMSYKNYRGRIGSILGKGMKGNIFYQGNAMWAVESMATDSLPTVIKSAIVWRGTEADSDNFVKVALSKKFNAASTEIKQATLEKYFDVAKLFGAYTLETLPTRYLETYADYKKAVKVVAKQWQEK